MLRWLSHSEWEQLLSAENQKLKEIEKGDSHYLKTSDCQYLWLN